MSHSELRHPQLNLLPSDTLTILCEISISGESVVTSGTSKSVMDIVRCQRFLLYFLIVRPVQARGGRVAEPASATRLSSDIGNIFHNGKFTDCTIVCEGREFKCHQNILAGRSSVFDAMFSHDMEEKRRGNVDIQDLDSDTVHDMIIYIYSGKVQGKLEGKATGLLSAAEKYDLKVCYQGCDLCKTIACVLFSRN